MSVTVQIAYDHHEVSLRVTDTGWGPPATPTSGGRGLIGMRERAASAGGTLAAGRARAGGFEVVARLPLGSTP